METFSQKIPSIREQTNILLKKNFLLFRRRKSFLYLHILFVIAVFLFGIFINYLISHESILQQTKIYDPELITAFEKCEPDARNCLSLGYVLYTDNDADPIAPWISSAMERIRKKLSLEPDRDSKIIYKGNDLKAIDAIFDKSFELKTLVFFCNKKEIFKNSEIDFSCDALKYEKAFQMNLNLYGIVFNQTAISPSYLIDPNTPLSSDRNTILIKQIIDEAIIVSNRNDINYRGNFTENSLQNVFLNFTTNREFENDFNYELQIQSFPKPKSNFLTKFDSMTIIGALFYLFLILFSFSQFAKLFSQEKTNKLRKGLIPYGLSGLAYWLSWIIFALIFNLFYTAFIAAMGWLVKAVAFSEAPLWATCSLFYLTLNAYTFLAILITTACEDYRSANKVTYTIFVLSIFMQMFFTSNAISNLFFLDKKPLYVTIVIYILNLFPSFPFTVVCNHIHFMTGYYINPYTFAYEKGPGYNATIFFSKYERDIPVLGKIERPSDFVFELLIVGLIAFYSLVIWICDNKIEDNTGHSNPLFGKLFARKRKRTAANLATPNELDSSLITSTSAGNAFLDLQNITKIFRRAFTKNRFIKALDKVSMQIRENETLSLLGENGAGKSTLISIITGVLNATEGEIYYRGREYGIKKSDKLLISVCPQYDLLWNELTVFENMWIIGKFRGMREYKIKEQIIEILENLKLKSQMENLVGNLSGGMKRRISIGLALMGNANLVIFDEPTTGLDPINRKNVWNFIKELKKRGKTILLTTHIMDEADYLSDRIAIINSGKILRVKTSIEIKNEFNMINVIFALKKSSKSFVENLRAYFEHNFSGKYQEKYCSESLIKLNLVNSIEILKKVVSDFEEKDNPNAPGVLFKDFIDSFEIASLDLEEAYMLVNEKEEGNSRIEVEDD